MGTRGGDVDSDHRARMAFKDGDATSVRYIPHAQGVVIAAGQYTTTIRVGRRSNEPNFRVLP